MIQNNILLQFKGVHCDFKQKTKTRANLVVWQDSLLKPALTGSSTQTRNTSGLQLSRMVSNFSTLSSHTLLLGSYYKMKFKLEYHYSYWLYRSITSILNSLDPVRVTPYSSSVATGGNLS